VLPAIPATPRDKIAVDTTETHNCERFRQARRFALDHRLRHLGSDVLRRVAGTARGQDQIESLGDSVLERGPKRLAVGNDTWSDNLQPEVLQSCHKDGPGRVLPLASRGTVR